MLRRASTMLRTSRFSGPRSRASSADSSPRIIASRSASRFCRASARTALACSGLFLAAGAPGRRTCWEPRLGVVTPWSRLLGVYDRVGRSVTAASSVAVSSITDAVDFRLNSAGTKARLADPGRQP
jgi:hypothetical protein